MDSDEEWDEPKYKNWVRGAKGLEYLQEGLHTFAGDRVLQQRDQTLQKITSTFLPGSPVQCNQCTLQNLLPAHAIVNKPCNQKTCIQKSSSNCLGSKPKGRRKCPLGICSNMYDEIVLAHRFNDPMWKNTTPSTWCSDPAAWSFGKCFQTTPNPGTSSAETDAAGLLSVIINDTIFQRDVACNISAKINTFSTAREVRNEILHSPKMELEDAKLQAYVDTFLAVLQDQKCLMNDQGANLSVQNLVQLKNNQITISISEHVILTQVRKAALHALERLEEIEGARSAVLEVIRDSDLHQRVEQTEAKILSLTNTIQNMKKDKSVKSRTDRFPPSLDIAEQSDRIMTPVNDVEVDLSRDPRTRELYIKAINEGKERDNNLRIMVVGCYHQGKTSLVRLLTGKTVEEDIESTNGIDVHFCDKDWDKRIIEDVASDRAKRLVEVAKTQPDPHFQEHGIVSKDISMFTQMSQQTHMEIDDEIKLPEGSMHASESICQSITESVNEEQGHIQFSKQEEKLKLQSDHFSTFAKEFKAQDSAAINKNKFNINIWDFGGQFVYYATHQLFHSKQAIYLLVFNLAQGLDVKIIDDDRPNCEQNKTMKDYLKFWVNSIHTFVGNDEGSVPPILLVGTHLDELKRGVDVKKCFQAVRHIFEDSVLANHIRPENFAISNIKPFSETLNSIRETIIQIGTDQSMTRTIPAKWIPLECSLRENQDMKIISFEKLKEIDNRNEISVLSDEQLKLFLQYFHEKGTFFFFENTEDETNHVVIKPQFLIDAFKCIITAEDFCSRRPELNKLWNKLCNEAILHKELLNELWTTDEVSDFIHFEKVLLFFLQKHRIIAEALQFNDHTHEKHPVSLGFYIVPSLLKKPAEEEIDKFLRGRKCTKASLGYVFEYSSVLPTVYNRVVAAVLGKWPVLKFQDQFMIYENVVGCKIGYEHADHAGLLQMKENTLELLVVNLVDDVVCPDDCDSYRRFVELVMEQELHKFQMRIADSQQRYELQMIVRCFDEEHSFQGSTAVHRLEILRQHKKEKIPCPDNAKHCLNINTIMQQWFKMEIFKADIPRRQLTEMELSNLSMHIGSGWETLGRHLGITDVILDHIDLDKPTTVQKIYEMLKKWKTENGESATLDILVSAIEECKGVLKFDVDTVNNLIDSL